MVHHQQGVRRETPAEAHQGQEGQKKPKEDETKDATTVGGGGGTALREGLPPEDKEGGQKCREEGLPPEDKEGGQKCREEGLPPEKEGGQECREDAHKKDHQQEEPEQEEEDRHETNSGNPIGGECQEEQSEDETSRNWCGEDGYMDRQSAGVSEGPTNTPSSPPPPLPEVKTELEALEESTSPAEYASPVRPPQLLKPKEEGVTQPWQRRTQKRALKQQVQQKKHFTTTRPIRPEEETADDDQLQKEIHEKKD